MGEDDSITDEDSDGEIESDREDGELVGDDESSPPVGEEAAWMDMSTEEFERHVTVAKENLEVEKLEFLLEVRKKRCGRLQEEINKASSIKVKRQKVLEIERKTEGMCKKGKSSQQILGQLVSWITCDSRGKTYQKTGGEEEGCGPQREADSCSQEIGKRNIASEPI